VADGDIGEMTDGDAGETGAAGLVAAGRAPDAGDDPWPIEPIVIEHPASAPTTTAPTPTAQAVRFMNSPVATAFQG
jgi:hypothetical protein